MKRQRENFLRENVWTAAYFLRLALRRAELDNARSDVTAPLVEAQAKLGDAMAAIDAAGKIDP